MQIRPKDVAVGVAVLGTVAFVYFVLFPEDVDRFLNPVGKLLALSNVVSPWLFAVVGVVIVAWAIIRACGGRPQVEHDRAIPPT